MSAPLTFFHLFCAYLPSEDLCHPHRHPLHPPLELCTEYTEEIAQETALSRPLGETQACPLEMMIQEQLVLL